MKRQNRFHVRGDGSQEVQRQHRPAPGKQPRTRTLGAVQRKPSTGRNSKPAPAPTSGPTATPRDIETGFLAALGFPPVQTKGALASEQVHEATHVVQQRAGVQLEGGGGEAGDRYGRHADAVADLVVQGKSAEGLLGRMADPGASARPAVQRMDPAEGSNRGKVTDESGGGGKSQASKGKKKLVTLVRSTIPLLFPPKDGPHEDLNDPKSARKVRKLLKEAYNVLRFYHGTNEAGRESIRQSGMSTDLKTQATDLDDAGDTMKEASKQHNYITKEKDIAKYYAARAANPLGGQAALVRMFRTPGFPELEDDPFSPPSAKGYRTVGTIPQHSVRQGKGEGRYSDQILRALQAAIQRQDQYHRLVSIDTIKKLLTEGSGVLGRPIESDSEDDLGRA